MIIPIKAGIITASESFSQRKWEDKSGALLKSLIEKLPADVAAYQVLPSDKAVIKKTLCHMADLFLCDLILTIGGTGFGPRDHMPEATREVIEKEIPGIAEAIRQESYKKTKWAIFSRAVAGIRAKTLIINLPGNPNDVQDAFETLKPIFNHAVQLIRGKMNPSGGLISSSLALTF